MPAPGCVEQARTLGWRFNFECARSGLWLKTAGFSMACETRQSRASQAMPDYRMSNGYSVMKRISSLSLPALMLAALLPR